VGVVKWYHRLFFWVDPYYSRVHERATMTRQKKC
jgi:hypothetical protein